MSILNMIAKWRRGCSFSQPDRPESCVPCTLRLINGIETALKSAQVRERDEQLTAALAACEKKDEALDADNSKLWPSKLREEAISIQPDASALNEYRNQVIEECATCCEEHQGSAQTCANAIRGLKK